MDLSEFQESFFEEAGELLADFESRLLAFDPEHPDQEQMDAAFRDAHSIKGGAGTFGFTAMQQTTHLLENVLDAARHGETRLTREVVDALLRAKDVLAEQLESYRSGSEPPSSQVELVRGLLASLDSAAAEPPAPSSGAPDASSATTERAGVAPGTVESGAPSHGTERLATGAAPVCRIALLGVSSGDRALLLNELERLGQIQQQRGDEQRYEVLLASTESPADIEAVLRFVVEPEQVRVERLEAPAQPARSEIFASAPQSVPPKSASAAGHAARGAAVEAHAASHAESSLRVPVAKVDAVINLVGELIITQSMLEQVTAKLIDSERAEMEAGIAQLSRNARDLQEAVMSIRMVPMDHVFRRFPRVVHDLAEKLGKSVELVTIGQSTELDKSLTEQIIDPLTHLIRNSLDHGIEPPQAREAAGKPRTGKLTLSAEHQGGSIVIEVSDDGAGLDRGKIIAKARERGLAVAEDLPDQQVWQLIFAPGFSTSEHVTDVSGRGVGMDVVKRNIERLGGHVEVASAAGAGTTVRVVVPLTLAILDGMSVRVGKETFILPLNAVVESLQPRTEDLYGTPGGAPMLKVRTDYLPVIAIRDVLQVPDAEADPAHGIAVVVVDRGQRYALLVDALVGQQQVVVKNLESNYRKIRGVSAATILGDGSVALILDVGDLGHMRAAPPGGNAAIGVREEFPFKQGSSRDESVSVH